MKRQFLIIALKLWVSGCQDSAVDLSATAPRRVGAGPTVPIAIQSIEGLPEALAPRFSSAIASEAQARDISFVDGAQAPRFRLRGYINAFSGEGGATIAWVWDVFDTQAKRAQRVSGNQRLGSGDGWSAVDDKALRFVAARSLDEIAGFLAVNKGTELVATSTSVRRPPSSEARGSSED